MTGVNPLPPPRPMTMPTTVIHNLKVPVPTTKSVVSASGQKLNLKVPSPPAGTPAHPTLPNKPSGRRPE
jgi:hypothetical protein